MQAEKPMGLIASYKAAKNIVPKICFLQPVRVKDSEIYSFLLRWMPSSLTNRNLREPEEEPEEPQQDIQDLVDGYMGELVKPSHP